jgi:DNA primase
MTLKQEKIDNIYLETALYLNKLLLSDRGEAARKYLISRGLPINFCSKYLVGCTDPISNNEIYKHLISKFDIIDLLESRVIKVKTETGYLLDYFPKNSIIFPVIYENRVISFSARLINSINKFRYKTLKYNTLGIFNSGIVTKHKRKIYIAEGAIDALSLNYLGYPTMGILGTTSLGLENAQILKNYPGKIIMCFDSQNNNSGIKGIHKVGNILSALNLKEIYYKILPKSETEEKVDINSMMNNIGKQKTRFIFGNLPLNKFIPPIEELPSRDNGNYIYDKTMEPNLLDLVLKYTKMTKCGRYSIGICPLPGHEDTYPSFVVYTDNKFKCFGCGQYGGPHKFLMLLHSITFEESNNLIKENKV